MKKVFLFISLLFVLGFLIGCTEPASGNQDDDPIITNSDGMLDTVSEQIKEIFKLKVA
ncbi:MAG: hypothetical protein AB7V00_06060 [Bacilli bacterium]